jgi:hypothetical protein
MTAEGSIRRIKFRKVQDFINVSLICALINAVLELASHLRLGVLKNVPPSSSLSHWIRLEPKRSSRGEREYRTNVVM